MPIHPVTERVLRGTSHSNLPPSVEAAYYRKCIELKRRVEEIEANNDKYRTSINRHAAAIKRLRLERAFLINTILQETDKKPEPGTNQPISDESESIPPTPQEKPVRAKRAPKPPSAKNPSASSPAPPSVSDVPRQSSAGAVPPAGIMAPGPTIPTIHHSDLHPPPNAIPGTATFRTYPAPPLGAVDGSRSSVPPTLPPISQIGVGASAPPPYANGTSEHGPPPQQVQEDVMMTDAPNPSGFNAVNQSGA